MKIPTYLLAFVALLASLPLVKIFIYPESNQPFVVQASTATEEALANVLSVSVGNPVEESFLLVAPSISSINTETTSVNPAAKAMYPSVYLNTTTQSDSVVSLDYTLLNNKKKILTRMSFKKEMKAPEYQTFVSRAEHAFPSIKTFRVDNTSAPESGRLTPSLLVNSGFIKGPDVFLFTTAREYIDFYLLEKPCVPEARCAGYPEAKKVMEALFQKDPGTWLSQSSVGTDSSQTAIRVLQVGIVNVGSGPVSYLVNFSVYLKGFTSIPTLQELAAVQDLLKENAEAAKAAK
jgi:hypothetical protein